MKKETLEQYLARGGVIKKLPAVKHEDKRAVSARSTTKNGPIVLLTLEEGGLMFGEPEKTPCAETLKRRRLEDEDVRRQADAIKKVPAMMTMLRRKWEELGED